MQDTDLDSTQGDSNAPSSPPINTIEDTENKIMEILIDLWKKVDIEDVTDELLDIGAIYDATQAINHLITQARIEQIMECFADLSLTLNIDEADLIQWRIKMVKEVQNEQ